MAVTLNFNAPTNGCTWIAIPLRFIATSEPKRLRADRERVPQRRMPMNEIQTTAESYRHYAQKKSNAHYRMCERAKTLKNRLGVPVTVATAIVGTAIFATLS